MNLNESVIRKSRKRVGKQVGKVRFWNFQLLENLNPEATAELGGGGGRISDSGGTFYNDGNSSSREMTNGGIH